MVATWFQSASAAADALQLNAPFGRTLDPEISETPYLFSIRVIRVIRGRFFPEIGVH